MAAFITDIIDSVTDDKKNNMCLVQHRRYEKSHSAVPKTERYAMIRRLSPSCHILLLIRLVNLFTFVLKFCGTLQKGPKDFPRNLSNTQWIQISFFKKSFHLKRLAR